MNDLSIARERDDDISIYKPPPMLDPQRLTFLWELAERITASSLVPESLRTVGQVNNKKDLPREQVLANVFFVVEQADRWQVSAFALIQHAAIVHGKLGFEGKVIAAILEANYGIDLEYRFEGEGDDMKVLVTGKKRNGRVETIEGSVKAWKTTGAGSPWRPDSYRRQLTYRGAREWARLHKPSAILGILSDDEIFEIEMERRALVADDVTPKETLASRYAPRQQDAPGFSAGEVVRQIDDARTQPFLGVDMAKERDRTVVVHEVIDADTGEITRVVAEPNAASDIRIGDVPVNDIDGATVSTAQTVGRAEHSGPRDDGSAASEQSENGGAGAKSASSDRPPKHEPSATSSAPQPQAAGEAEAGGEAGKPGLSAEFIDLLRRYDEAIGASTSKTLLATIDQEFWGDTGPANDTPEFHARRSIYSAHLRRVRDGLGVDECRMLVKSVIQGPLGERTR